MHLSPVPTVGREVVKRSGPLQGSAGIFRFPFQLCPPRFGRFLRLSKTPPCRALPSPSICVSEGGCLDLASLTGGMADTGGGKTESGKSDASSKPSAVPNERPKRESAKKFVEDIGSGRIDGRKALGESRSLAARKNAGKVLDNGTKRAVSGGAARKPQPLHHSEVPKVSVDAGLRRLDLAALKRYKKHFNLKNLSTNNKEDLQAAVIRHFAQQLRADSGKTERMFLKFLKQRDD